MAALLVWGPIRLLDLQQKEEERTSGVDMPSYGGVVANSYLPSNWLSALGCTPGRRWTSRRIIAP
jgi:KDO II ethanolaminephosphotransferase